MSADGRTGGLIGPDGQPMTMAQATRAIALHPDYVPGQPLIFYDCYAGAGTATVLALAKHNLRGARASFLLVLFVLHQVGTSHRVGCSGTHTC